MGMLASFDRKVWYLFFSFYRYGSNIRKTYMLRSKIVKSCPWQTLLPLESLNAETSSFFNPGKASLGNRRGQSWRISSKILASARIMTQPQLWDLITRLRLTTKSWDAQHKTSGCWWTLSPSLQKLCLWHGTTGTWWGLSLGRIEWKFQPVWFRSCLRPPQALRISPRGSKIRRTIH